MYPTEFVPAPENRKQQPLSYGQALKEVAKSGADLFHKELLLLRTEFTDNLHRVREHTVQVALFGGLLAISVLPLLAFLVIGLGELLDHRYWLSSLIVGVLFAVVGGTMASRALKKIKKDISFARTRSSVERTSNTVQNSMEQIKHAIKGDRYGSAHSV